MEKPVPSTQHHGLDIAGLEPFRLDDVARKSARTIGQRSEPLRPRASVALKQSPVCSEDSLVGHAPKLGHLSYIQA